MKNQKGNNFITTVGVIIMAIILLFYFVIAISYAFTKGTETITVKDKWVKFHSSDAKYLISANDNQVFEISDTIWYGRWDSSNLYSDIDIGETCNIMTQGFRFPFLSRYKNIITADCFLINQTPNIATTNLG